MPPTIKIQDGTIPLQDTPEFPSDLNKQMAYPSLSSLTPAVVDRLYNIDRATPMVHPTFLFLVGAPGAGKSTGHARALTAGLLPAVPAAAYATLNLDILLESLLPFRAASAMAHLLKQKIATITAYGTRKENLGIFKWYNTAHDELAAEDPDTIAALNTVRAEFASLQGHEASERLLDLHEAAIQRAIHASIPIVYETTLSLNRSRRVAKVDEIMSALPANYRVVMWHIKADPDELPARVRARQEIEMPADPLPYYRYVPSGALRDMVTGTAAAFERLQTQYAGRIEFEEYENPFNPARAPVSAVRSRSQQRNRIVAAYGPRRLTRSWRVSTPRGSLYVSSSSSSRRSSSSSRRGSRRSTRRRSS
jgi:hypothetical protein